jgi:metabotropic glutamate receptor 2/3
VANLFRLFKIPQISYASTSAALSDKTRFDYFARTVPPDNFQAKAIADIVDAFNWTYVSTVASEGNYGEMGIESFKHEATLRNICIAEYRKVAQSARREDFDFIIGKLLKQTTTRVVILFLRVEDASNLLLASKRRNKTDRFVWIASDGWGSQDMPVRNNEQVAEGAITIELQSTPLVPFDRYFMSLTPANTDRDPWFNEYWEHVFDCKLTKGDDDTNENVTYCVGNERISTSIYKQETKIQFVYDAVYALAHALDNMFMDQCGKYRGRRNRKRCILNMRIDGESLFYNYLLNVSFNGK